jgi:hypothetical protein
MNFVGNIISGQVMGSTSKMLTERYGTITQIKESVNFNLNATSDSKLSQMDFAIPQSEISSLSSGGFVGMVADDPDQKIELRTFHCEKVNNHRALSDEARYFQEFKPKN